MKIFKKFLAALIAVVMAFAVFAFAACNDDGNTGDVTPVDPNSPSGGGDNELTTAQLLTAVKSQQIKYAEINASSSTSTVKPATVISESSFNAKVNLADLDIDFEEYSAVFNGTELVKDYDYTFVRGGYTFVNAEKISEKAEPASYSTIPLYYDDETVINTGMASYVPAIINNANYVLLSFADVAGALTIENGKATIDLNKAVYNVVQDIKAVVSGLTEETTVGDLLANENIKKYLSVFTELIPTQLVSAGLEKLPDLLEMLNSLTQEDLESQFGDMAEYVLMVQALLNGVSFDDFAAITPDAGSTTYDYIVKLIGSDSLRDIVNKVFENYAAMMGGGQDTPPQDGGEQVSALAEGEQEGEEGLLPNLTDISVKFILDMVNAGKPDGQKLDLVTLKKDFAAMTANVTEEGFYFAMPSLGGIEGDDPNQGVTVQSENEADEPDLAYVSGAKIEYTLSGTAVTAQSFAVNVATEAEGVDVVSKYNASVTYSQVKYQLADISGNTVIYDSEICNSGTYVSYSIIVGRYVNESVNESWNQVYYSGNNYSVSLDFVNGEIKEGSLIVYDKDKNVVTPNAQGEYTFEIYREITPAENETPAVYDYNDKQTYTLSIEVTGGTLTQEVIDGLEYNQDYYAQYLGFPYIEIIRDGDSNGYPNIVYNMTGKVSDLLTHLKAQASQPNA